MKEAVFGKNGNARGEFEQFLADSANFEMKEGEEGGAAGKCEKCRKMSKNVDSVG